ncbi:hypothetical protein BU26DRAFT_19750 [Trematosphaeria pertusa]|uniref:Protein kinase domain-containing protein n=1 Tax=Trematosphaeria pertusa TaxID=390896 RepID=A0A6A6J0I2_9PLEO|nr:uncharacterized protein BU26DRAFT_19750 [Trematosphaeria pertusa]KAF2256345.1 hypothetical protein BU26DRAFT_19750 [Trematosphaeria pertusa]
MTCLKALLDNGHTDAKVPLTLDDCPRERHKRKFVTGFLVHQKRFNTPYFAHESSQSLDDRVIPIWLDESRSNMRGKGAFGEVYPARIHRDHHSLSCVANENDLFALKVTQHAGREHNYHVAMAGLNHPHLVKCLASFTFRTRLAFILSPSPTIYLFVLLDFSRILIP